MMYEEWEQKTLLKQPKADPKILQFIWRVATHGGDDNPAAENAITNLFASGYCYYFAKMLENNFKGKCMWVRNVGHIVFVDPEGIAYDIHGVNDEWDENDLVPLKILGLSLELFKHGPGEYDLSPEEKIRMQLDSELKLNDWEREHGLPISHRVKDFASYLIESEYEAINLAVKNSEYFHEVGTFLGENRDAAIKCILKEIDFNDPPRWLHYKLTPFDLYLSLLPEYIIRVFSEKLETYTSLVRCEKSLPVFRALLLYMQYRYHDTKKLTVKQMSEIIDRSVRNFTAYKRRIKWYVWKALYSIAKDLNNFHEPLWLRDLYDVLPYRLRFIIYKSGFKSCDEMRSLSHDEIYKQVSDKTFCRLTEEDFKKIDAAINMTHLSQN